MPDPGTLLAFCVAALIVLVIPGPGVAYVTAQAIAYGRRGGIVSAAGLSIGVLAHAAAAALGLSALLLVSAQAMTVVKFAGAAYLIYLGVKALRTPSAALTTGAAVRQQHGRLLFDGVAVSVLNPKIAVFFLAFLPQFIDPAIAPPEQQVVIFGVLYCGLAFITDSLYALVAHALSHRIVTSAITGIPFNKIGGWLMIGLGVKTALTDIRD